MGSWSAKFSCLDRRQQISKKVCYIAKHSGRVSLCEDTVHGIQQTIEPSIAVINGSQKCTINFDYLGSVP